MGYSTVQYSTVQYSTVQYSTVQYSTVLDWMSALEMLFDEQFHRTGRCDFALSKENFFYEHVAFAFPKGSPWIPWFNEEIKLMLQSGMIIKWKEVMLFREKNILN